MTAKLLTMIVVLGMAAAACAYDRDPATPDEFARPDFKSVVEEVRAAQASDPDPEATEALGICVMQELLASVDAGDLLEADFVLWSQGLDPAGPAATAADELVEQGVC